MDKFAFGWFSSGRGQGSIDLLTTAHQKMVEGFIPGRIAYVFCDREPGETPAADRFHAVVRSLGLPLLTLSSRQLREAIRRREKGIETRRQEFDAGVLAKLANYEAQVVVLAGYMLVLSPLLCEHLLCLNLHPAVPGGPKGTWRQVMWQLMETEAPEAGAMLHLATPALDEGPPVTYCHFPLRGPRFDPLWSAYQEKRRRLSQAAIKDQEGDREPLFAAIRAEELRREFPLVLATLRDLATGALVLTPAGVKQGQHLIPGGLDISAAVEAYIRGED